MRIAIFSLALLACGGGREPVPTSPVPAGGSPAAAPAAPAPAPATSPAARPPSVSAEMAASADRVVGAIVKLAIDVDAAADCAAATAALRSNKASMQAVQGEATALEQLLTSAPADAQQWFKDSYSLRLNASYEKMGNKVRACQGDAAFKQELEDVGSSHP